MPWLPIETAPKAPGRPVLLCRAGDPLVEKAYWWPDDRRWIGWYKPDPPTHWMEMPLTPAQGDSHA